MEQSALRDRKAFLLSACRDADQLQHLRREQQQRLVSNVTILTLRHITVSKDV